MKEKPLTGPQRYVLNMIAHAIPIRLRERIVVANNLVRLGLAEPLGGGSRARLYRLTHAGLGRWKPGWDS